MYLLLVVKKTDPALWATPPKEANLAHHFLMLWFKKITAFTADILLISDSIKVEK